MKYLQHNTLDVTIMLAEKGNSCQSHSYKNESNFLEYKKSDLICIGKLGCQECQAVFSVFVVFHLFELFTHVGIFYDCLDQKEDLYCSLAAAKKPQPPR